MADKKMHRYWAYRMAGDRLDLLNAATNFWHLFKNIGSGFVFEIVWGILGICALGYSVFKLFKEEYQRHLSLELMINLYCIILIVLTEVLCLMGKLPAGEAKFSIFTVPVIAFLIAQLLDEIHPRLTKPVIYLSLVLWLALVGNIFSTIVNTFFNNDYEKRMRIYSATQNAIINAQRENIPILVTNGVAFHDDLSRQGEHLEKIFADIVLKTFPAYDITKALPVKTIVDTNDVYKVMHQYGMKKAIAGNGETFRIYKLTQ
jgi:hypothetical protein